MPAALKKYHDREEGFTLVELLIVVLIIGILAAVAIPIYLGIQNSAVKSAVRADVNIAVKSVQVGLTGGTDVTTIKANQSPTYMKPSQKGETVNLDTVGGNDFTITGIVSTTSSPVAGRVNFTYQYDSRTGKFTESDSGNGQPATLTINTTSLPDGNTTDPYSATVNASGTNTTGTNAFTITGLPGGLTYNSTTGKISGTPTANGTYPVTVSVVNGSSSASQTYALRVYAKPAIATTTLPGGTVGNDYNQTLVTTADPAATFAVTTGTLPAGLNLNTSTGVISGQPTAANTYPFTVTATNSVGSDAKSYTIVVNATPVFGGGSSTPIALTPGALTKNYSQSVTATGTPAPTYTVSAGALPAGVTLDTNLGTLGGTPTAAGNFTFTIKATNSAGNKTQDYTLTINGQLATPATSLSRFIGRNSVVSWNAVPNATSYQVTYAGAYTGTYTTTSTSYQQTLPIGTSPTNVTASVKAISGAYADSNTGSTSISVPGSRMNGNGGFSICAYDGNGQPKNVSTCGLVSTDGAWVTVMQGDGNFVEYKTDVNNINTYRAYYATQVSGSTNYTTMQTDGNLVAYNGNGAIKATNTGVAGSYIIMQTDGNLALYNPSGVYMWGTINPNGYNASFMLYVGP